MTFNERRFLAMHAIELITRLEFCDDEDFVDYVLQCVVSGDTVPLEPKSLLVAFGADDV